MGGRDPTVRSVLGLGTTQRNVVAALVLTTQNFTTGNTLAFVLVAAIFFL